MVRRYKLTKVIKNLIKGRIVVISLLAVLFVFSLYQFQNIKIDNALSIWFVKEDRTYDSYVEFQKRSGSDEIIIASIPVDFNRLDSYRKPIKELQSTLEKNGAIERSFSLFDATYPLIINNKIAEQPLFDEARSKKSQLKLFDQLADLSNQLIAEDRKSIFLYVQLFPSSDIEELKSWAIYEVISEIRKTYPNALISGPPVLNESYNQSLFFEAGLFGALSLLVIVLLLFKLLSRRKFLGIAMASILLPTVILFGFIGYLGIPMNMVSALIPTLLLVYALSDVVHILNALDRAIVNPKAQSRAELLSEAVRASFIPCSLTTLTTLFGYLALYFSGLPALKSMGILAGIGIMIAFFISYVVVIVGFSFLKNSDLVSPDSRPKHKSVSFEYISRQVLGLSHTSRAKITTITLVLLGITLLGSTFVIVDTDSADLIGESPVKKELYELERQLGGSFRMQLDLKAVGDKSIVNPAFINRLGEFTAQLRENKNIGWVLSLDTFTQFIEKRYPQLRSQGSRYVEKSEQFLTDLQQEKSFFNFLDLDRNTLSVTFNFPQLSAAELSMLIEDINTTFDKVFAGLPIEMQINGFATVFAKLNAFVVESQLISFVIALIAIGLFLVIYLKSFRRALIVLIPNVIPVFAVLALMALFDIPLGVTTAMIAPIILGIGMDDTIHLLYHFRKEHFNGQTVSDALTQSIGYTTPALIVSSASLSAGFLIIAFSYTPAVADFGLLCLLAVIIALITDLLLLPALIRRFW